VQSLAQEPEQLRHGEFESLLLGGMVHEDIELEIVAACRRGVAHRADEDLLVRDRGDIFVPCGDELCVGECLFFSFERRDCSVCAGVHLE